MKKKVVIILSFFILTLFVLVASRAPEYNQSPKNDERPLVLGREEGSGANPEAWEDGMRTDGLEGSFEWWYFDAHMDDDSTAIVTFLTRAMDQINAPLSPFITITIIRPDGSIIHDGNTYHPSEFRASKNTCDVAMGENFFRGDLHDYEISAKGASGTEVALHFSRVAPSWRPGTGIIRDTAEKNKYFGWFVAIPSGDVTGTLTYDGVAHRVTGRGYHDHNWGNVFPGELFGAWTWGRLFADEYTMIFVQMTSRDGDQKMPFSYLARGENILMGKTNPEITMTPIGNSQKWAVGDANFGSAELTIAPAKTVTQGNLSRSVPSDGPQPWYQRFLSDFVLRIQEAGGAETKTGIAISESVYFDQQ